MCARRHCDQGGECATERHRGYCNLRARHGPEDQDSDRESFDPTSNDLHQNSTRCSILRRATDCLRSGADCHRLHLTAIVRTATDCLRSGAVALPATEWFSTSRMAFVLPYDAFQAICQFRRLAGSTRGRGTDGRGKWHSTALSAIAPLVQRVRGSTLCGPSAGLHGCCRWRTQSCLGGSHALDRCSTLAVVT